MPPTKQDFIALTDWDRARIERVLGVALRLKKRHFAGRDPNPFAGLALALVFEKPSLRTRVSLELAFQQLGGRSVYLSPEEVGLGKREAISDVARVLSGMVDVIATRTFKHQSILELARWASIPVVNALSDFNHPCQVFADLLTLYELKGRVEGLKVAWVGDGNNVAVSWINAARRLPFELTLACPEGYDPDPEVMKLAQSETRGRVKLVRKPREAVRGADVIYADTFVSMGQEQERAKRIADFKGYKIDQALLKDAAPDAVVMHCLPAHRGEEITDEVMDGPQSVVFPQAHNRLHAQKAIFLSILGAESAVA